MAEAMIITIKSVTWTNGLGQVSSTFMPWNPFVISKFKIKLKALDLKTHDALILSDSIILKIEI